MATSWRNEEDGLECRWSVPEQPTPYRAPWIQETPQPVDRSAVPSLPDFAAHSPLGSGEWFAPWNARWSVPGR
jgi:hypothetical protein